MARGAAGACVRVYTYVRMRVCWCRRTECLHTYTHILYDTRMRRAPRKKARKNTLHATCYSHFLSYTRQAWRMIVIGTYPPCNVKSF